MILSSLKNWQECRTAILEFENDAIYLYNYPHNDKTLTPKSLWVANTKKRFFSKSNINSDFKKGLQPYLPKEYCVKAGYISDYKNEDNWDLQWGLDQNSIAVYFKDKIIAILPEWSGNGEFYGYSRGTNCETRVAWPLTEDNIQIQRFLKERDFLNAWTSSKWEVIQETLLSTYKNMYQGEDKYFAADGGKWPPLGVHYCKSEEVEFLATVGMSQLPMPEYGMNRENTKDFRRIEIAMAVHPISDFLPLAQYISGQATYPWYYGTHFDHGHTLPCKQLLEVGSRASFVVFIEVANFLPQISMPSFTEDATRLLYMLPIYESEQKYAKENSTQELIDLIEQVEVDPFDIYRDAIV